MNYSQSLESKDKEYIWHPFTQMKDYQDETPLIIKRGDGVFLEDTNGKRYIDGVSSMWCNVHGHKKREIDGAIRDQIEKISHSTLLGQSNVPAVELAEKLIAIAPVSLRKVFYSDNGSTTVEIALKIAFQYWSQRRDDPRPSKTKFVHLNYAYHGDTTGALSVGGIRTFRTAYKDLLFDSFCVPSPYCYRCQLCEDECNLGCLSELEEILKDRSDEIAGLIIEPLVQMAGGVIVAPQGYLSRVWELCKQHSILLIADEVATGFGRTGTMFACQCECPSPDIICLGKGLTGGYLPLAATLTTQEIYEAFLGEYSELRTFFHGHTYTGNQLSCAAALANLDVFEKEGTLDKLPEKIDLLKERLEDFKRLAYVGDVRQCGFVAGIELVLDRGTKEPYPPEEKIGVKVCQEAKNDGLLIRPLGNIIVIMPPLSIDLENLEGMLDIIYKAIIKVTGQDN